MSTEPNKPLAVHFLVYPTCPKPSSNPEVLIKCVYSVNVIKVELIQIQESILHIMIV